MQHFKLYGFHGSGNCLKVKWTADHVGWPYTWMETDSIAGETRTEAFLSTINPVGKVPAIVFDDGRRLFESNAIIWYLAQGSDLIPQDPFQHAQVHSWLSWEQYFHEPAIAVRRALVKFRHVPEADLDPVLRKNGIAALELMDGALAHADYLVGERMSIADISLLAYTRVAPEGGFDLAPYEHVRVWIARCEDRLGLQ